METITSAKNNLIKQALKIKQGKSEFIILEGPKQVEEGILNKVSFFDVFIDIVKQKEFSLQFSAIKNHFIAVSSSIIKLLGDTVTPQGIVAVVKLNQPEFCAPTTNFVILDGLQDAGNLGTIIRSCVGANFLNIYCINCVSFKNEKVIRSAMGNIFKANLFKTTYEEIISATKKWNLPVYLADMNGQDVFSIAKPNKNFGIVIGNEGNGLSKVFKENFKDSIKIPMQNGLESLNAAVCCSVLMFVLNAKKGD